jgi:RNA-binding protein Nova
MCFEVTRVLIQFFSELFGRKITITGSQRAIHAAEDMIMQKVSYASERETD